MTGAELVMLLIGWALFGMLVAGVAITLLLSYVVHSFVKELQHRQPKANRGKTRHYNESKTKRGITGL